MEESGTQASTTSLIPTSKEKLTELHEYFLGEMENIWREFGSNIKKLLSEQQDNYSQLHRVIFQKLRQQTLYNLSNAESNHRRFDILTEFILKKGEMRKKAQVQDCELSKLNFKEHYNYYCEVIQQGLDRVVEETVTVHRDEGWVEEREGFRVDSSRQLSLDLRQNPQMDCNGFAHLISFIKSSSLLKLNLNLQSSRIQQDDFFLLTHAIKRSKLREIKINLCETSIFAPSIITFIHVISRLPLLQVAHIKITGDPMQQTYQELQRIWEEKMPLSIRASLEVIPEYSN